MKLFALFCCLYKNGWADCSFEKTSTKGLISVQKHTHIFPKFGLKRFIKLFFILFEKQSELKGIVTTVVMIYLTYYIGFYRWQPKELSSLNYYYNFCNTEDFSVDAAMPGSAIFTRKHIAIYTFYATTTVWHQAARGEYRARDLWSIL